MSENYSINNKNIDKYYDLFDSACMILVNKAKLNYLQAFLRIYEDIKEGNTKKKNLSDEDVGKLEEYENQICDAYLLNEEIRQALVLIMVKAFKHVDASLDLMTPDSIAYIFTFIIQNLFEKDIKNEKKDKISILDINLGTSNLINLIANNLSFDANLTGIEIDEAYAYISEAFSSLQGNEIVIYKNSCLDYMTLGANAIIGDLDCRLEEGKYLPYEAILKYQHTNIDHSFMIFLVDNDFFNQEGIDEFKKNFKGTIIGLIMLDEALFKKKAKSILIISPKKYKDLDTLAIRLPSAKEEDKYRNALIEAKEWLRKF